VARKKEPSLAFREFRTVREIDIAVTKLKRRVADVEALAGKRHYDPAVAVAEAAISSAILDIYGPDSPEYRDHQFHNIYFGAHYIGTPFYDRDDDTQAGFEAGIPHTVAMLNGLVRILDEKRGDLAPAAPGERVAAGALHPRLSAVSLDLYRDGHYAQAVVESAKALVNMVKEKSRLHDLDGSALMTRVFSANSPVVAFNELQDQTDRDEQQGMMHLYAGAVLAIRNPRSHETVLDTRERADELLGLLSFLAGRLDEARRV